MYGNSNLAEGTGFSIHAEYAYLPTGGFSDMNAADIAMQNEPAVVGYPFSWIKKKTGLLK